MICKKKSVIGKSEFLTISLILIIVGFIVFVFAATPINSPVVNGNYSGTLNLSVTTDVVNATNVTCYYNASGGTATLFLVEILNDSEEDTSFENASISISGFNETITYNISCSISNLSGVSDTNSTADITIDNTAPNVSTFYNTVDGGSYKDSIVLNVSVSDTTIVDSVYFNITNSTGDQHNFTKASTSGGGYYNITVNTTKFTDGAYNITVWANDTNLVNGSGDSVTHLNNTEVISVTFDDTNPTPSSLIRSSYTRTSLTITFSGADGTCTAAGSGTRVISGSTLTVTGLSCGNSYAYTITCVDAAENSGASSLSDSFATSNCGGGGTIITAAWTNTYTLTDEDFEAGKDIQRGIKERVRVRVTGSGGAIETHHIGVKEVTETSATIEIASDPVQVTLNIGDDAKVDVTDDGYYDIYVKLNTITDGKADITVQKIYEEIPEGEEAVTTTGEIPEEEEEIPEEEAEEKDLTWLWVLIGILILAAVVGGGVAVKKRK